MRILDRYLTKSFSVSLFGCLFAFIWLYTIIDLFSNLSEILKLKASFSLVLYYYFLSIPFVFLKTAPYACLLATIFSLGRMNRDNEIIAIRSSGISLFNITKPIIIFGLILSIFSFYLNERIAPESLQMAEKVKAEIFTPKENKTSRQEETLKDLTFYSSGNRHIHVSLYSVDKMTMRGITVSQFDKNQNLILKIVAEKGVWQNEKWLFSQCIVYNYGTDNTLGLEPEYYEKKWMSIEETPQQLIKQRQRPELMSINQLSNYIKKISNSGASALIRDLNVDFHNKLANPLSCLVLILIAIPFSVMHKKRGFSLSSILIALGIGFLYYVVSYVGVEFGRKGIISPFLAAWLANISFILFSVYIAR